MPEQPRIRRSEFSPIRLKALYHYIYIYVRQNPVSGRLISTLSTAKNETQIYATVATTEVGDNILIVSAIIIFQYQCEII
jgi:hypothetical protein